MGALRVTRMASLTLRKERVQVVAFELLNVKVGGRHYDAVAAELRSVSESGRYLVSRGNRISTREDKLRIPPGLEMTWRPR